MAKHKRLLSQNQKLSNCSDKLRTNSRKIIAFSANKALLLFSTISILNACSPQNRSIKKWESLEWQRLASDGEASSHEIYTRKVKGSPFKEFKIKGIVQASPKEAIAALRYRTEQWQEFYAEDQGFFEIIESSPHELLVYSVFKLPFPFKARSMCERFFIEEDTITGTTKITWHQEWEKAPPEKGIIRMPVAKGSWIFETHGEDESLATYQVYTDPGGRLPGWMYNSTVRKGLPKELEDIGNIAANMKAAKRKS